MIIDRLNKFSTKSPSSHCNSTLSVVRADLPTCLYLTTCMEIGRSTDVRGYFSKYRRRVCRRYKNSGVNEFKLISSKVDRWGLIELSFVDICIFQAISRAEAYCQYWLVKKFFKPMNIDFVFKALWKLVIFRYGGFEFKAVGDMWLHETDKVEEECKKSRKQAPTRALKKGGVGISDCSTHGALLLEKVFYCLWSRTTLADV